MSAVSSPRHAWFAAVAPWIFVLLWSTGFIGARLGLPHIEPFTFLSIRFIIVATLISGLNLVLRAAWPASLRDAGHSAVVGLLLHGGYLGGVFFAIDRGMPAGLAALIVSLQPILTAMLAQLTLGEAVDRRQWIGLLLGFVGVALVVGEKLIAPGTIPVITPASMTAVLIALVSTTIGTLYQKRFGANIPLTGGVSMQFVAAATFMIPLALIFEQQQINWNPELFFALGWLVLVLSLGAILLLMTLIRMNSAARVTSLFYLVPPATALEAWLLFGEGFGWIALAGIICVSAGVALVVARRAS
jgi:drug/metabolite transporter (DMT)-like permease